MSATDHCVPVANGTDALELAMRALLHNRRARGREAITVANAGGYAVTACRLVGLTPVFADIDATHATDVHSRGGRRATVRRRR